jgi:RNA:NAD 2'-phosphotransferase (TPT1/KptA family)
MSRKIQNDRTSLEKILRYILGIAPDEYGLTPGEGGFIGLKELLAAVRDEDGFRGTSEMRILELNSILGGKSPFEIEGSLIRVKPELASLPPEIPEGFKLPKELFVALKPSAWPHVHRNGLIPRRPKESKVILFIDKDLAFKIAKRTCPDPLPVRIQAYKAKDKGVILEPYGSNLVLCDFMPGEFILGPPIKEAEDKEAPKNRENAQRDFTPVTLSVELEISKGKKRGKYGDEPEWKVRTRRDRRDKKD